MTTVEEKIKGLVDISCQDGNWNYDPYMQGLANGLILAQSVIMGEEPVFLGPPVDGYLSGKPMDVHPPPILDSPEG